MRKLPDVTVKVRNIAVGGDGVGEVISQSDGGTELLGISAFVPFSARGETVSARVVQHKERFLKTELISVDEPSASRCEPRCPLFMRCGGCELQHISIEEERAAKLEMIRGALRAARFESSVIDALQPLVGAEEYGYRRRVSLHIDSQGRVGFFQEKSRSVVPVTNCPVAVEPINEVLESIQDFGEQAASKISSVLLETDENGVVAVLKSPYDLDRNECSRLLQVAKNFFPNAVLQSADRDAGGYGRRLLELPLRPNSKLSLRVPAGYFSQVNWTVNQKLVDRLVYYAEPTSSKQILDLYAGAGNFSLPLANAGAKVAAVECDTQLVSAGRQGASSLSLGNIDFIDMSVERYLKNIQPGSWDVLIADPPRSGLGNQVSQLPDAQRLIVVYCHLPSFVRDLKTIRGSNWNLISIEPFDMFSRTSYVETMAVFDRAEA